MKKILFMLSAGIIVLLTSCGSKKGEGGMSATAKKNLEAQHAISKMFDTKDFSKLGDYLAADGVDHAGENGDVTGLENMKTSFIKMSEGYENSSSEIVKELADDEYVMTWQIYKGTMKKDEMGMKAGDKFAMNGLEITKFKDGKATEHWSYMSPAELMKMMPAPGNMIPPPTPADTSKMENK